MRARLSLLLSVIVFWTIFSVIISNRITPIVNKNKSLQSKHPGRSGAMEALESWTAARAYPFADIPPDKYYTAYVTAKQRVKELPRSVSMATIWEPIGPLNLQGRSNSVALNPQNPTTVYIGTASGGLWRSYSEGIGGDWQRVPIGYPALSIGAIAIHPADSNTIYIGTGEVYRYNQALGGLVVRTTRGSYGIGILKTTDGGTTWSKSLDWSLNQQRGVQRLAINPSNPNTIFAATTEGIYKSVDAGTTWNNVLPILLGMDIVINSADTAFIMASMGNFNTAARGVYVSYDAGENWFPVSGLPAYTGKTMLGTYGANPYVVFASVADDTTGVGSIWRTTDFGSNWTMVTNNTANFGVQGWYSHFVAVHPADQSQIFHASVSAVKSSNGGASWFGVSGSYSDHHSFAINPVNPDIFYVVNDDGIYRSTNFGTTFSNIGFGLQTGQLYNGFSNSSQDSLLAIGQSQDHIPGYLYRGNLVWERSASDEAGWTAINPANDNIMYAGNRFGGNIRRSSDRGASFPAGFGFSGTGAWNSPFVISPSNTSVLYFGDAYVYKSTNTGSSFALTNGGAMLDGNPSLSMAISSTDPNIVYVGTAPRATTAHVFATTNGGTSWTNITGTLPNRYPIDLAVDPNNSQTVYIAMGGFGAGHFFKSTDGGANWTDISTSLPDVPGTAIAIDPINSNTIYVGNDIGVYASTDGGTTWSAFNEGLTDAVLVADLVISPANRTLRVVTHGNGVYERKLIGSGFPLDYFDYSAFSLTSPLNGADVLFGLPVTPIRASFRNNSSIILPDSVDVKYRILSGTTVLYTDTRRIVSLGTGETRVVTFAGSFVPPDSGMYSMEAIVFISDSNSVNDTLHGSFRVFLPPTIASPTVVKDYCPYVEITGGTAGPSGDDVQSIATIPFGFVYDGYTYNFAQISTNGWLELGAGTAGTERGLSTSGQLGGFFVGSLGTAERPSKALGIWWTDMATGSTGQISYTTTGSAPNRVFIVQWKNVLAFYDEGSTSTLLNFQIALHETSNEIEFRYGPVVPGTFPPFATGASIGFKDHIGGDYHYYDLVRGITGTSAELARNLTPVDNWPGPDSCYHIQTNGTTGVDDENNGIPQQFALLQNYPNPFNPNTNFEFRIANVGLVSLKIYDLLGKEVATLMNEVKQPGNYNISWNANGLASGVYLYRLTAGSFVETKKLILLR